MIIILCLSGWLTSTFSSFLFALSLHAHTNACLIFCGNLSFQLTACQFDQTKSKYKMHWTEKLTGTANTFGIQQIKTPSKKEILSWLIVVQRANSLAGHLNNNYIIAERPYEMTYLFDSFETNDFCGRRDLVRACPWKSDVELCLRKSWLNCLRAIDDFIACKMTTTVTR